MANRSERARAREAGDRLLERIKRRPRVAMLLGTGHSAIAGRLKNRVLIHGDELPEGMAHRDSSQLLAGELEGVEVVVADSPLGAFEGYTPNQVTFPVRVLRALGADTLVLTGAGTSLCPQLEAGALAVLEDHINLSGIQPLQGPNDEDLGPSSPDLSAAYDPDLRRTARETAIEIGIPCLPAVFACVPGPSLPTRAEYRFLSRAGADAVGVSLVPEVLAAVHAGFRILAMIGITQQIRADCYASDLEAMIDAAELAAPRMASVLTGVVASMA